MHLDGQGGGARQVVGAASRGARALGASHRCGILVADIAAQHGDRGLTSLANGLSVSEEEKQFQESNLSFQSTFPHSFCLFITPDRDEVRLDPSDDQEIHC